LPGGTGTLEELFEVWTWAQLVQHAKPCALLDINGFYSGLASFLEHIVAEAFLKPEHREMLIVESDADALLAAVHTYQPPRVTKWIRREDT